MKTCGKCGGCGPFAKDRSKKDGLASVCKACRLAYEREYLAANKEQLRARRKVLRQKPENKARVRTSRRRYYRKNQASIREKVRAYYHADSSRMRDQRLRQVFGITLEQFERMNAEQFGLCAICGRPQPQDGKWKRLYVDHDHRTGAVRALLCRRCNTALGMMDDDPARLRAAAAYLERHSTRQEAA